MSSLKVSQNDKLRKFLKSGNSLTQESARSRFGVKSPSKRFSELRAEGLAIRTTRVKVRDKKTGETKSVVRYAL